MITLSYSRIQNFRCPFYYKMVYVEKILQPEGPAAEIGTLVHGALEFQGEGLIVGTPRSIEASLNSFIKSQTRQFNESSIKKASELLSVYSKRKYQANKIIGNEKMFNVVLPNGVPVTGRIDRIEEWKDSAKEVIDFKTNNVAFSDEEVEHSLQLGLYALVEKIEYPDCKIITSFDFIKHGRKSITFTKKDLQRFMDQLSSTYEKLLDEKDFNPVAGEQCRWCHVKGKCPLVTASAVKAEQVKKKKSKTPTFRSKSFPEGIKLQNLTLLLWENNSKP